MTHACEKVSDENTYQHDNKQTTCACYTQSSHILNSEKGRSRAVTTGRVEPARVLQAVWVLENSDDVTC